MRRRVLLATLAAGTTGLAGCAGLPTTDPTATQPRTDTQHSPPSTVGSRTPTASRENSERRDRLESIASVITFQTNPYTLALSPTRLHTDDGAEVAVWFDRTETDAHPARLTGYLENRNDFVNTFQVKWLPLVGRTYSRQPGRHGYEATLYAVPTENNDIAEVTPDVYQIDDGHWVVAETGSWIPDVYRLDPGERVQLEYVLVGHPEMEERPTGTYEFRGDEQINVTVWDTHSPGPDTGSRFAGRTVPTLDEEFSLQWFHDADESTGAFVEPSTERMELDGFVSFEMVNHTGEVLRCGHWNLYKLVDGEWFHVGPFLHTADCRLLLPGGTKEWTLRAFNSEPVECGPSCGGNGFTRGFVGGGEYAIVAGYGHPEDKSGAFIEFLGDPVEFTLTEGAAVERDGDTVTVTTDQYRDDEHPPDDAFALTRVDSAEERVIPEQIATGVGHDPARELGLRNALAVMDSDVRRVVVQADEHVVGSAIGHDRDSSRFTLLGQAYQARRLPDEQ